MHGKHGEKLRDSKTGSTRRIGPPNLQKIASWIDIFDPFKTFRPALPRGFDGSGRVGPMGQG